MNYILSKLAAKDDHFCSFVFCEIRNYLIIEIQNKIETKQGFRIGDIFSKLYENNRKTE